MNEHRRYFVVLRGLWLALACCSASNRGCLESCANKPSRATLYELRGGNIEVEHSAQGQAWQALEPGAEFKPGDSVRTGARSSAKLRLPGGSELWLGPASQVRFLVDAQDNEQGIELITGEAVIMTGGEELRLRTHVGLATLRPGSSVQLTRTAASAPLQLRLEVGQATFRTSAGEELQLSRGEGVQVAIGSAVIRLRPSEDKTAEPKAEASVRLRVEGAGIKAKAAGAPAFEPLADGEVPIAPGTELAVADGTRGTLVRDQDQVQLTGGEYTVQTGDSLVAARRGGLQVQSAARDVHIAVPGGFIIARAVPGGTACDIRVASGEGTLTVSRGEATWNTSTGRTVVTPGTPYRWTVSENAELENAPPAEAAPEHVSLVVRAGESFVVHAAQLPVALSVQFEHLCSGEGVVELKGGGRQRGTGHADLWLHAAARSYSLRCVSPTGKLGPIKARGSVRALEDAGTRELPRRPPTSHVDADGRTYTIYYQNQLPDISIRWPNAPAVDHYLLEVDHSVMSITKPEHVFTSGSLRDGPHRLTFSAKERRSRTTHIEIHFDNTTTTASLSAPANGAFSPGRTVEIEGVALPAWKVSVDGGTIESSGDGRFRGQIVTDERHPDFAVRLSHPRLGTHYYVRRASRSP